MLSFHETNGMIRYFYFYSFADWVWLIDIIEEDKCSKELSACSVSEMLRNEDSCNNFDSRELSEEDIQFIP